MMKQVMKNTTMSEIAFIEGGIVRMKEPPEELMGLTQAKEMMAAVSEFGNGDKVALLGDLRAHRGFSFDQEGRAYLGGKEAGEIIAAAGLLVGSPISKFMGNFFISIVRPVFPLKLFTSESEAIEWLKGFL